MGNITQNLQRHLVRSPMERHDRNEGLILDWLYRWGVSLDPLLSRVVGLNGRTSTVRTMLRRRLLQESLNSSGWPEVVIHLSESGLMLATAASSDPHNYPEVDAEHIDDQRLRHDLLAQAITLGALGGGHIIDYQTPRMLTHYQAATDKIPDAIWIHDDGRNVAIEVEMTPKYSHKLDTFIAKLAARILSDEIDSVVVISDHKAVETRYRANLLSGMAREWRSVQGGGQRLVSEFDLPDWVNDRFSFVTLTKSEIKGVWRSGRVPESVQHWIGARK